LFATHYFELTRLAQEFRQAVNVHLDAVEHKDHIVFLHSVEEGPANQSYGLQVAQLAGIPAAVVRAAKKHLFELEAASVARDGQPDLFAAPVAPPETALDPALLDKLNALDPDALTPKQALETLYAIRQLLDRDR
jgi:DNA mismatch repair protein MutS